MNFLRRNKGGSAPKEDLKQVTVTPKQPQNTTPRPNRNGSAYNVLSKKDDIPQHSAVLSITGGPIELTPEWQKKYAILLTNRDKKEVEVICSLEVVRQAGLDDDYLAIVDRIKRSGYVRTKTKVLAKPEIIQIIYEQTEQKRSVEEQQKAATKIQLEFDELLISALKSKASDIHIEVTRKGAEVRFRVNGALQSFEEWPVRHARTMAGVIYMVIAEEKDTSFDERREQSAIIDRDLGEYGSVRVRLNTLPNYPAGFDMIMRILKMGQSGEKIDLNKLGYQKEQLSKVRRAVAKPVGAIIMAGTTGSGKSTSLNAMLSEKIAHHEGRIKVITVEDPPEYLLPGATQVPVVRSRSAAKEGADVNPFASTVRAAMRSDPDVLMIGEVRDVHSAELLIHAVQSGHQVFSTTHASSGVDIISRLRSNGIPDDVLGSHNFIAGLLYQTLLQTVCSHCSTDFSHFKAKVHDEASEELVHRVYRYLGSEQAKLLRFINPEGCPHCRQGVTGRTVAAEVILPDAYMLRSFRDRQDSDAMMHYAYNGGKFALHHGIEKMLMGLCDIRDVEHKLDQIAALQEMASSVRFFVASSDYSKYIEAQKVAAAEALSSADNSSMIINLNGSQVSSADRDESNLILPAHIVVEEESNKQGPDADMNSADSLVDSATAMPNCDASPKDLASQGDSLSGAEKATEAMNAKEDLAEIVEPEQAPVPDEPGAKAVLSQSVVVETKAGNHTRASAPEKEVATVIDSETDELAITPEAISASEDQDRINCDVSNEDLAQQESAAGEVLNKPVAVPLLTNLLHVLKLEVERTGISLSGKFFKARLSKTAILALAGGENTPADIARELSESIETMSEDELAGTFALTAEDLQALIDSDGVATNSTKTASEETGLSDTITKPQTKDIGSQAALSAKESTPSGKNVTSISRNRASSTKEKAPAKPRAPRKYKSKLLSAGEGSEAKGAEKEVQAKGDGNVKSLAEARAKGRKAPAKPKKDTSTDDNK